MKKMFYFAMFMLACGTVSLSAVAKDNSYAIKNDDVKLDFDTIKSYSKMVAEKDYSLYDEVYYDFQNEPLFLDTKRPNLTEETYKPYIREESDIQFMYDDGDGTSTNGIYGIDDRNFLSNDQYTIWPYRAICQLEIDFYDVSGNPTTYLGTGALVAPNIILTASHCVYSTELGWSSVIRAYPGCKENTYNYGYASSNAAAIGLYFNTSDSNDDWALVRLNADIGNTVGYFGLECADLSSGTELKNIAYNGTTRLMSYTYGRAYDVEAYKFYHRIDAIAGSSGSPIFKERSMNICGIHSAGIHNPGFDYNIACRVSNYLVNDWGYYCTLWA